MKTNDPKQSQDTVRKKNASSGSSAEASSKMLKTGDGKKKPKSAGSEKYEGTLRHKEGEKDK